MTTLAFIDSETTGLDPRHHEMWELAIVTYDSETVLDPSTEPLETYLFQFAPDLEKADLIALNIGRYFERHKKSIYCCRVDFPISGAVQEWSRREVAELLTTDLQGAHLVGAVPDFDARFLSKFLFESGGLPTWHYHLVCVENLAAGYLGLQPPWKSDDIFDALDISRDHDRKHTAMGDVEDCIEMYRRVMSPR